MGPFFFLAPPLLFLLYRTVFREMYTHVSIRERFSLFLRELQRERTRMTPPVHLCGLFRTIAFIELRFFFSPEVLNRSFRSSKKTISL